RGLIERLMSGVSPRELIANGGASPRLLEAVLSDLGRRGAIVSVQRADGRPYSQSLELPPRRLSPARGLPALPSKAAAAAPIRFSRSDSESARIAAEQLKIADTEEESNWFSFDLDA